MSSWCWSISVATIHMYLRSQVWGENVGIWNFWKMVCTCSFVRRLGVRTERKASFPRLLQEGSQTDWVQRALRNTWPYDAFDECRIEEVTSPAQSHSQGHHTTKSLGKSSLRPVNPREELFRLNSMLARHCLPPGEKSYFFMMYIGHMLNPITFPPRRKWGQGQISIYVILSARYTWTQYNGWPAKHIPWRHICRKSDLAPHRPAPISKGSGPHFQSLQVAF